MYDQIEDTSDDKSLTYDQALLTLDAPRAAPFTIDETSGDQTGAFADFIRKQPIIMLSVAFGLGLLATSLLARRRS
jgi:hypothetical protein